MKGLVSYTLNCGGRLLDISEPRVMGILNVTPDSFYSGSRKQAEKDITERVHQIIDEGASIIDIGAYSSRPNASDVPVEEEKARLRKGLQIIFNEYPDAIVSVDTFRSDVAKMCVEEYGAAIINDISGGAFDSRMFDTVAALRTPYILMHIQGTIQTMQQHPHYENITKEVCMYFAERVQQLRDRGARDIILDPGFGFGKTLEHNYELMARFDALKIFQLPILSGISRKSMIYKLLGGGPEDALNGTTVLNTLSLLGGANILRVHDVKPCVETIKIVQAMLKYK